jgi:ribosomal protein L7/L12
MAGIGFILRCVGQAAVAKGVKGLCSLVPLGEYVYEVAEDVVERVKREKHQQQFRQDVEEMVKASTDEVKQVALEVTSEVAADQPPETPTQIPLTPQPPLPHRGEGEAVPVPDDLAEARRKLRDALLRGEQEKEARRKLREALTKSAGFDVVLDALSNPAAKFAVVNAVMELTGRGLADSKRLVERAPVVLRQDLPREEADAVRARLEKDGAKVTLRPALT